LRQIGSRDAGPGTEAGGIGGRLSYRIHPSLDFDGDLVLHPNAGVCGYRLQGFFGVKAGARFGRVGIFAKARPGLLHFAKDPFGASKEGSTPFEPRWASSLEPTLDLGGVLEYHARAGPILRFDLGDTIVRYGRRSVSISQLQAPISAGGFTTHNWQCSLGVSFRF
jgi:hypothetical protein